MLNIIFKSVAAVAFLMFVVFHKRVMRYLQLDPNRARDLFGYFFVALLVVMLDSFISKEWTDGDIRLYIIGVIMGIPIAILGNYFTFRNIRDNVLGSKPPGRTLIAMTLVISICLAVIPFYLGLVREFAAILWGACLSIFTVLFIDILRYEKTHGILFLKRRPDTSPQPR